MNQSPTPHSLIHKLAITGLLSLGYAMPINIAAVDTSATLPQLSGTELAHRIASAAGHDTWNQITEVSFTWTHKSGKSRAYKWNIKDKTVTVTMGDNTITIPTDLPKKPDIYEKAAHQAFVNDRYWTFYEHHLCWDNAATSENLGFISVPQFPELGPCLGLSMTYPQDGGYTPGDRYVVYADPQTLDVLAWSYFPGSSDKPALTVTRQDDQEIAGLHIPTRFLTAGGTEFIHISDIEIQ